MSLISFRMYALISSLLTIFTFTHAYYTRHHFYPVVLYLTTHKPSLVVLANLFFLSLVTFGITIKSTFLSQLNRDEVEELIQLSKYAITETCLALTIFREELSMKLVGMFTLLLFSKQFHWLSQMRVEHVARSNQLPLFTHIRLAALLLLLLVLDCACVSALVIHFTHTKQASVLILFLFESLILTLYTITVSIRYILTLIDFAYENRWSNKSIFTFYLDFTSDFIRLLTYLAFFAIICTYYGLPLHLIRELCVTFYNLRERIVKFIAYRRLTANMNERFADATREELESGDRTCIVCREDMVFTTDSDGARVKKLSCSHLFHFACLRTWLERSQSCPTCRADIPMTPATSTATAANPVADPVLPPLPPHLQAHLDALNARQQQQQPQQQQSPTQVLSQAPPARSLSTSPSSLTYTPSTSTSAASAAPHTHQHIHRPHPSARINFSQLFGSDHAARTEEKSNANTIRSFSPILTSPLPPLSPSPPPSSIHSNQMAAAYPHPMMMMMPQQQQWHPQAQNAFSAAAFPHFHTNVNGAMPVRRFSKYTESIRSSWYNERE